MLTICIDERNLSMSLLKAITLAAVNPPLIRMITKLKKRKKKKKLALISFESVPLRACDFSGLFCFPNKLKLLVYSIFFSVQEYKKGLDILFFLNLIKYVCCITQAGDSRALMPLDVLRTELRHYN